MTDRDVAWSVRRARATLRDYTLSRDERAQEVEGLAECLASAETVYLENLQHRRKPARGEAA